MTDSEIIKQCKYSTATRTWIWDAQELDGEGRATVFLSKFLHFREVEVNGRTQEVVEILEAPLKKYLKTLKPVPGYEFAGRYYRDFKKI
jgi:hypothetical protein